MESDDTESFSDYHTCVNCSLRLFGYGSLLWKPDFEYSDSRIGFISGYKRRFWQGSDVHRGTDTQKGRVATLVPSKTGKVWGMMFEVNGAEQKRKAYGGLTQREVTLGGYDVVKTSFYPRDGSRPVEVEVFVATRKNRLFLGKASLKVMAMQIMSAAGCAGSNAEYIIKTAEFLRANIPEETDRHLFDLCKRICDLSNDIKCLQMDEGCTEMDQLDEESDLEDS
ncbi:glutathione-specific gamma-glutamylcyclotransferase 1-like [Dreissena polymorpha]|uniref:glutathione-specific gamma-glutamylcyclotransferase n=1 Tax=Dreissena polymorpha TaxID=45954 RepID=A0A9D4L644_DREPO|nr:glutathione-specific gamma-glutamylcyclotransferase 1-like [Dreissena polymorpha]KAH3851959.1 hypothetical protein DPMN_094446 [Dreissena polymorpha]